MAKNVSGQNLLCRSKGVGLSAVQREELPSSECLWLAKKHDLDTPALSAKALGMAQVLDGRNLEQLQALVARGHAAASMAGAISSLRNFTDEEITAENIRSGAVVVPAFVEQFARQEDVALLTRQGAGEKTVAAQAKAWCDLQEASDRSLKRKQMNCLMLTYFRDFLGGDEEVSSINEETWENFYKQLATDAGKKPGYKKRIMAVARNWLNYLYEKRLIELPRNLRNHGLAFKQGTNAIVPADLDTIRAYFAVATGQSRLHLLLMLNCGFTAVDISDLQESEVNWKLGTIRRKRSKTKDEENVPTVTYKLWRETFALLKKYRSGEKTVLLTKSGKTWVYEHGKTRSDNVAAAWKWIIKRVGVRITPKKLRLTAATELGKHPTYKFYGQYFLGHAPRSVAEKHYQQPNDEEFFEALAWLEKRFALPRSIKT